MKLFISYARDDKAWVYELWRALRDEAHHDAWLDRRLVPAQDWWGTILENIEACECFVYVMTPISVASIYCRAELEYALALNKPVLPLMLKPCDFPPSLSQRRVQYQVISDDMNLDRVLFRTAQGLTEIRIGLIQGQYAPPTPRPPRPDLPTPEREPEQLSEVLALAEDAVAANSFPLAEKLFQQVMAADPDGWGLAAAERLAEIRLERDRARDYLVIVRMVSNPTQARGARSAASVYVRKYGQDYDPNGILPNLLAPPPPPDVSRSSLPQTPPMDPPPTWDRAALRDALGTRLSLEELRSLAFDLRLEYEGLEKGELERRIIRTLEQRGQLDRLLAWLQTQRPDLDTARFLGQTPATRPREQRPRAETVPPPPTPRPAGPALGDRMTDADGVTMVYVPPGAFMMGSSAQEPGHKTEINHGFWLDLTPVTNAMYARFVKAGGYKTRELWTPGGWQWVQAKKKTSPEEYKGFTDPDQPRVGVTWFEAYAYCQWRGGRLPSEAEWEWAARGPENRVYPWGNDFDAKRVIFSDNSGRKTAAVNAQTRLAGASWVGALDMSGNVWEWTNSLYRPYPYDAADGRENPDDDKETRALRSGSWNDDVRDLRAAVRDGGDPTFENCINGFRCARSS